MVFGRKISNRLILAVILPPVFVLAAAILLLSARGHAPGLWDWIALTLLALAPATILGRLLIRPISQHLDTLVSRANRLEQGEYAEIFSATTGVDELAEFTTAFDRMSAQIALREGALREQNQALAANSHRFAAVLDASHDGIAMLDQNGHFVLVNRRFGELLGRRSETLVSQEASAQPLLQKYLEDTESSEPRGVSERIIEMDGDGPERRSLQFYTAPVQGEDGREAIGRIVALRDITRERELDKLKTDFISVVSHELRTPLTSIKGYTDLLLSGATGEISELQSEFLSIIQSSTTRLSNLINDILDISRIESGTIEIKHEPIDYRRIVADTLRLMKAAADEKQISMDASLPESIPPVRGDIDKVAQVLGNLVSNAIKYTPEGGWVKVSLEITGEASVLTSVTDSGIGISPEDQKRLFQKFFRADNTSTREAGGTGLGLVIAKTIVELLGGAIWVESEPGRGTRFYFTLPLYLEASSAPAPLATLPDRGIGLVLIVDDDSYVRSLIRHALHRRGYGTLEAGSSEDAALKARLHKPDAITLDMMMPEMDGLRALRVLKSDCATASVPVVLVSVLGDPVRGEFTMGAFSFLQKPISEERVREVVLAAAEPHTKQNVLAVCPLGTETCQQFVQAASSLRTDGVHFAILENAPEAVGYVISETPALILLDTEMPDTEMFALLTALKAEEEAARIPIVILTEDISQKGIHFHLGTDAADNTILLDYLCDQVGRAISGLVTIN